MSQTVPVSVSSLTSGTGKCFDLLIGLWKSILFSLAISPVVLCVDKLWVGVHFLMVII